MIVYRLSKQSYIYDLSGLGAEINGGRWNSKGTAIVYAAASRALAVLEIAMHTPLGILPADYFIAKIEIKHENNLAAVNVHDLPPNWNSNSIIKATQLIGDKFAKTDHHLVLQVPSTIVPGDFNYLINPMHTDFKTVKIINTESYAFDMRLFKK